MDPRVKEFICNHAGSLIGLDVALFLQANPQTFDTAEGLARRTHRDVEQVKAALERLTAGGILEVFNRSSGRYQCYALAKNAASWNLLCLLSEAYLDNLETRKEIIRMLMRPSGATETCDNDADTAHPEEQA